MKERIDWTDEMVLELLEYYEKRSDSFQSLGMTFFSELSEKIGIPVNRISEKFIRLKHQYKIVYENGGKKGSLTRDSDIYKKMFSLFGTSISKNSPPVAQTNGLHNFKVNDATPMINPENNSSVVSFSKEILCPPIQSTAPDTTAASNIALSAFHSKAPPAVSISTSYVPNASLPLNLTPAKTEASQNHLATILPAETFASNQPYEAGFPQMPDQNFLTNHQQNFVSTPPAALQINGSEEIGSFRRQEIYLQKLKQEQDHALEKQKQDQFHAVEMRRLELAERELAYKEAKLALRREKLQRRWSTPQENHIDQPSRD